MTVARVDPPLPSTAPDFVHVTLDSSGSYKDVPMDQLYTIFLDAHGRWTENDGCRAQGAQVRNAVLCFETLTALFELPLSSVGWISVLYVISISLSLQMIGRNPTLARPTTETEGVSTQKEVIDNVVG